jgi:hypothetical protein
MTIAGQTFTVDQAASVDCLFLLDPASASVTFPAKGGSKSVKIYSYGTPCGWMAVANDLFITITGGASGTGSGKVDYTVPGNTNAVALIGTMTIAGQAFTVNQDIGGCIFKLSSKRKKFTAAGGSATVKVNPNFSDCDWTAVSNDSFITITAGDSGIGKGTVSYSIPANASANVVTGSMTVAGETFTVIQSGEK